MATRTVVDLTQLRVVARVPVGDKPNGISFSTVTVRAQSPVTVEMPEGHGSDADAHGGVGH